MIRIESTDALDVLAYVYPRIEQRVAEDIAVTDAAFADLRESLRAQFVFLNRSLAQSKRQRRARAYRQMGEQ